MRNSIKKDLTHALIMFNKRYLLCKYVVLAKKIIYFYNMKKLELLDLKPSYISK